MIPYHTTQIDTIAIQINCGGNSLIQSETVVALKEFLYVHFNSFFYTTKYDAGAVVKVEHKLYCNNRTVLSIQTGFSHDNYFVKIRFAGLATYDHVVDNNSLNHLWAVMAYINTYRFSFNLAELDIAIDVPHADFDQLLAFCSSHTSRTAYHGLDEIQVYEDETSYLEKFKNRIAASIAIKRAYLYDKRRKEIVKHNYDIGYEIKRFEVKLQSKYFNKYGLDISMLEHTLSKYHLLYFENPIDKYNIINRYNNYSRVTKREIDRMSLEKYRLYPDMEYIDTFLYYIQTITMEDLYSY